MELKIHQEVLAGKVSVSYDGYTYTIHKEQVGAILLTHEEALDLFHMLTFILRKHTK